ncbi:MAG: hypothetical protein KJ915_07170 [Candidatus Omnitrophica bacterium]|nr:hypothetical protein [Candidatus Omnitrophota bacterium]
MDKKDKKSEQKKKYQPPRVDTREIYEINALGCAKCVSAANISLSISCIRGTKKYS